jgi:fructose-1,6-bisphosphatase/sedoheptulose 1,7-bisphosphatase-like protein
MFSGSMSSESQTRGVPAALTVDPLVMRSKSGTIRLVESEHQLAKLAAYASVDFSRTG